MKRLVLSLTIATLISIGLFTAFFNPKAALATSAIIYIRADGSIDPPDGRIVTVDSVTYTLAFAVNNDVLKTESIVVERDNIVLDGAWHVFYTHRAPCALSIKDRKNVTVTCWDIRIFALGIEVSNSSEIRIHNNSMIFCSTAINMVDCSNNTVSDNSISPSYEYGIGIRLTSCSNNAICRNRIVYSDEIGIELIASSNNTIYDNSIHDHYTHSLKLTASFNNDIFRNNMEDTHWDAAIRLSDSSNNTIHENNFTTVYYGLSFTNSSSNKIYHNNFLNILEKAVVGDSANTWDKGYPSGGNCWSDYTGVDADFDGIGDTQYIIDENNTDHYPLMTQHTIPEFISFPILPLSIATMLLMVIIARDKTKMNNYSRPKGSRNIDS